MNEPISQTAGDANTDVDEVSLLDLVQSIAENIRLLVVGSLGAGLLALGISFMVTPTFTASTKFLPPQQQQSAAASMLQSLGGLGALAGAATGLKNPNDQYVAFLTSRSVEDALIERFKLIERYEAKTKGDARRALEGATRVNLGKDGLVTVEVDDADPAFAAELANAYVDELGNLMKRLAVTEAQQRRAFFENQLAQTKKQLTQAEQALKTSGMNPSVLKSNPEAAVTAVAQLQAQIAAQEVKIASMRGYLTESSPDFKQAQTELAALRSQMARAEKPDNRQDANSADYVARFRDFKYYETLFELFAKQFELAKVDESREGALIQVLDVAEPPERKSKPKKAIIAIMTTLGVGFVLLLFVLVRRVIQTLEQSPQSAQQLAAIRRAFWKR